MTPGTNSVECRLLLQCIRVRAKANSEFSREEVWFRTAHDELFHPSPSESVSVPGIEAKDDSTGGRGHSGRYYPHKSKWWRYQPRHEGKAYD